VQIVIDGVLRFKAPVASPNYKPPEGYDGRLCQERDIIPVSWDRFSYAVMAYELIMGSHPYGVGTYQAPYDQGDDTMYKIKTGLFLHGNKSVYLVARHDESLAAIKTRWNGLPESLRLLFMRAFEKAQFKPEMRPSMAEWGQALSASILAFKPDEARKIAAANAEREFVAMPQPVAAETSAGSVRPASKPSTPQARLRRPVRPSAHSPAARVPPPALPSSLTSPPSLYRTVVPGWLALLIILIFIAIQFHDIPRPYHPTTTAQSMPTPVQPVAPPISAVSAALGDAVQDVVGEMAEEVVYEPLLKPGMYWRMQSIDRSNDANASPDVNYQIDRITDNEMQVERQVPHLVPYSARTYIGSLTLERYDKSWNPLSAKSGSFAPAVQYYDFPLKVGKTWSRSSSVSNNATMDALSASGEVKRWQDVQTPAGKFRALKVEVILTAYRSGELVDRRRLTLWYCPEVKHAVRREESIWNDTNQSWSVQSGEQLTAYSGAGQNK